MGKRLGYLGNQQGQSLVMSLVGIAAVAVIAMVSAMLFSQSTEDRKSFTSQTLCREMAEAVLLPIRSNGIQSQIFNVPISSQADIYLNDSAWKTDSILNPKGIQLELGANAETRWPNVPLLKGFRSLDPPYASNGPLLIQGAVNGLQSIYNSNAKVCSEEQGLEILPGGALAELAPEQTLAGYSVKSYLRLRPYKLSDRTVLDCLPVPLRIRPMAQSEPPPATYGENHIIELVSQGYRSDIGIQAEVSIHLTLQTNRKPTADDEVGCSAIARFQFEQNNKTPPTPFMDFQRPTSSTAKVSIAMDPAASPSVQMVCMEENISVDRSAKSLIGYSVAGIPSDALKIKPWRACDRLTICGTPATPGSVYTDKAARTLTMAFRGIDPSCQSTVRAVAFDVTGNLSSTRTSTRFYSTSIPVVVSVVDDLLSPEILASTDPAAVGWEVAGVHYASKEAARMASMLTGSRMRQVTPLISPQDAAVIKTFTAMQQAHTLMTSSIAMAAEALRLANSDDADERARAEAVAEQAVSLASQSVGAAESTGSFGIGIGAAGASAALQSEAAASAAVTAANRAAARTNVDKADQPPSSDGSRSVK